MDNLENIELVKDHLYANLPMYMIPNVLPVDCIPLTLQGKIDHTSLRQRIVPATKPPKPASTETEMIMLELLTKIFNKPIESVHLNFFEIGGHSLTATSLISAIRDKIVGQFNLADVFRETSFEALANHIDNILQVSDL